MLYQAGLGNGTVGQHEIIVRADGKGGDGMGVVTRLNLVHHDEWFTLRYQLFNILTVHDSLTRAARCSHTGR